MENTSHTAEQPRVGTIEMALDALVSAKPKAGEKTYRFVARCVSVVQGRKQRQQLYRAIIDSLNELGIKATDPASSTQLALNAEPATTEGGAA